MSFTPGPWSVEPMTLTICRLIISTEDVDCDAIETPAKTVAYVPTNYDCDEQHDNARLISAAPELLHACLTVKRFLNQLEDGTAPEDPLRQIRDRIHSPLHRALDAAIAKATNPQCAGTPGQHETEKA